MELIHVFFEFIILSSSQIEICIKLFNFLLIEMILFIFMIIFRFTYRQISFSIDFTSTVAQYKLYCIIVGKNKTALEITCKIFFAQTARSLN